MAKRCVLIDKRVAKDQKTGDDVMFLTLAKLPSKMKNGDVWHQKKDEILINIGINKKSKLDEYNRYVNIPLCSLIDVTFGINDFTNKTMVATYTLVPGTNVFSDKEIFGD